MAARRALGAAVVLAIAAGCRPAVRPTADAPTLVRLATIPAFRDDGRRDALSLAVRESLAYYRRLPPERAIVFGRDRYTAADMQRAMATLLAAVDRARDGDALLAELRARFVAYRAAPARDVLFTGYFVPSLVASGTPSERFRYPVLGRPHDLVTVARETIPDPATCGTEIVGRVRDGRLVPYPARADIERGAVPDAPVLAWVADPLELFVLQIQGSGVLAFADGARHTIGFAGSNGRPYVSIGKLLLERGALTPGAASMPDIRRWIDEHPDERRQVLEANPRYVFFRYLDGPPLGSIGVPVTAGRSIATDPSVYPEGAPAVVRIAGAAPDPPLERLVLNQDAGAAIRGPGRVDVFFGDGAEAEAAAGRMRAHGELYFLAPRQG
jgi:membrane-bound lytic murein transglycosylase A